ncbi:MAG: type II toxin-antitoxin system Phd/YefM family antitoxin [Proteobacteria bacterium]|jgi:prevent-host-death family protein|nr:type II toxin-antitoxin system Phd/YefM family antitoxin [Pseudomonadota bacterium]NBT93410.1 type II toxin-antitoxin system Phd/YefM family antitoxin [Chloroflexota bacterium]NBQ32941.1 type II toxin-antitoxin system Phd/YefM family antitoxin [Pseudomonadota bacterium]NBT02579.1 type II toxin-antitoxin system Phd/YefM family antitoxin [Pseudomonadota bacterium]NBY48270.1 type II toxin-antitoxin system Phd/YefM family antitoxin [Pseudomonadota bacterium]
MGKSLRPEATRGIGGPVTDPGTRTMNATSVRQEWRDVVERVYHGDHRVIVERSGIPVAAIVSVADLNRLLEIAARLASPVVGEHTTNAG